MTIFYFYSLEDIAPNNNKCSQELLDELFMRYVKDDNYPAGLLTAYLYS